MVETGCGFDVRNRTAVPEPCHRPEWSTMSERSERIIIRRAQLIGGTITSARGTSAADWCPMSFPIDLPLKPMLAKLARAIPDGDNWLFEPKWDGFRHIVAREGDSVELFSRNERPFARYFPELLDPLRDALAPHCVVDGEVVVPDDRRRRARLRRAAAAHPPGRVAGPPPRRRDPGRVHRLRRAGDR